MYYNQELGLCIEFGPVRVDSVRRGGPPPSGSNPPCAGSRHPGLLPGLLVIACYLSFTPSSLKFDHLSCGNSSLVLLRMFGDMPTVVRNNLPRDTAMALMDHLKAADSERRKAQRYAQELQLGMCCTMVGLSDRLLIPYCGHRTIGSILWASHIKRVGSGSRHVWLFVASEFSRFLNSLNSGTNPTRSFTVAFKRRTVPCVSNASVRASSCMVVCLRVVAPKRLPRNAELAVFAEGATRRVLLHGGSLEKSKPKRGRLFTCGGDLSCGGG